MESAIAFYHAVLMHSKPGEPALAYLRGRGFTDATIEAQQLGWAPAGWDQLVRQLATKRQVTPGELLEVGLASPRQRGGGVYDRFRERVIFPIRDTNGHPVGLGGRVLPAPEPSDGGGRVPVGHPPRIATTARSTSTRRRPRCSTRAARCTSSTAPSRPSARPARP